MAQEINILVKPWANPIPNSNSEDDIKKRWANSIPKIENILDYVYLSHCVHIHYVYLGSSMQIKTPDVRRLFIPLFVLMCVLKTSGREDAYWHRVHLCGFS